MTPDNPSISEAPPAEFYVLKGGEMFGPFNDEQLREGLKEGHFAAEDFAQAEGQSEWLPLASVLGNGAEGETPRGAMAPDWKSILRWAWFRLRYNFDEQSFPAGLACLGVGVISLVLSRWPFVFWLPWFAAAAVASVALLKRKQERHGAALLIGAVCIPLLFIVIGSLASRNASRISTPPVVIPNAPSAPSAGTNDPQPNERRNDGRAGEIPSFPAASQQPPSPIPPPDTNTILPEPVSPHYAPSDSAPAQAGLPAPQVIPSIPAQGPVPLPTSAPGSALTAKTSSPSAPAPQEEVDFVQSHSDSLVLIKGDDGSGSGFICSNGKATLLYTNIHVAADIKQPVMTRLDGELVSPGAADVAAGRDIARFEISKPPQHPMELITDFESNVHIGDQVVVLGNSGGGGVVTKIAGEIQGIGPDRIEVSAEFIPGNSGSPIIHVKTGKVIGIATYLTRRYEEFSHGSPGPAPAPKTAPDPATPKAAGNLGAVVVRRFGYRIDNMQRWETVRWAEFRQDAETMEHVSALTEDIFDFFNAREKHTEPKFATETLRRPAMEWLGSIGARHLSEADQKTATRGFLNALRAMVRGDVTTADQRLRYTYFREKLHHEKTIRDELYKAFDELASVLATPQSQPTAHHKSGKS